MQSPLEAFTSPSQPKQAYGLAYDTATRTIQHKAGAAAAIQAHMESWIKTMSDRFPGFIGVRNPSDPNANLKVTSVSVKLRGPDLGGILWELRNHAPTGTLSGDAAMYIRKELLLQYREICWDDGLWNQGLWDQVEPRIRLVVVSPEN